MKLNQEKKEMRWPVFKYKAIYADPPWRFKNYSEKGEARSASSHYNCMSLNDIKALPVQFCADDDCVLFLWATFPLLQEALDVIKAWGFTYKTAAFTWAKRNKKAESFFMGLGYWTRSNAEICLLATRGKPERKAKDVRQLCTDHIREHSRKPDEIYERIERLVDGPYIELFSRNNREGWDAWGNEVGKFESEAA